ncbi:MAG: N-acetyltransferase family protein [Pseudomonadota bacterium]
MSDGPILIRAAGPLDAASMATILNSEITTGTASWKTVPIGPERMRDWLFERFARNDAVVVACPDPDQPETIAGYGSFGPFRSGEGYARTAEHSVYVDRAYRRRGVGRALIENLLRLAGDRGIETLVGGVSADQSASLALHRALGFAEVGRLEGIGLKDGQRLDLVLMQRRTAAWPG